MSSVPLLSAPGAGKPSRSASSVVAKPTRAFHIFRIDGYSWTKALPGGEHMTSEQFDVGGRLWQIDYYPNGTDGSSTDDDDSSAAGSIALYLRMQNPYKYERVRVEYKFSLLDLAGNAAYELPAETGIFTSSGAGPNAGPECGCGYVAIAKEELERRRDSLLGDDDRLAIRCDVGVTVVTAAMSVFVGPTNGRPPQSMIGSYGMPLGPNYYGYPDGAEYPDEEDDGGGSHKGRRGEPDDKEYIRRCLSSQRRK